MKLLFRVFFLLIALFILASGVAMAQAPIPPVLFQGKLIVDETAAPVGTVVVAEIDGEEVTSCTVDGTKIKEGQYMLAIPNNGYIGKMVVLKVNDIVAGEHEYISSMDTFAIELDLDVETNSSSSSIKPASSTVAGVAVGVAVAAVIVTLLIRRRRHG